VEVFKRATKESQDININEVVSIIKNWVETAIKS